MGTLKKFMAHADMVKISCVDTTDVVENARKIHKLNPTPTAALGRLLTMGLLMGTMSKGEKDKITLQIIGDGPLGSILVVADSIGNVKGYVSHPWAEAEKKDNGKLNVSGIIGNGELRVIKDLGMFKEMSDVIIANRYNDDIADVLDKVYTRDLYFRD